MDNQDQYNVTVKADSICPRNPEEERLCLDVEVNPLQEGFQNPEDTEVYKDCTKVPDGKKGIIDLTKPIPTVYSPGPSLPEDKCCPDKAIKDLNEKIDLLTEELNLKPTDPKNSNNNSYKDPGSIVIIK